MAFQRLAGAVQTLYAELLDQAVLAQAEEAEIADHAMRFLDYLIAVPTQAVIVGGAGILVNVPDPGRFALHKLLVSSRRSVAEQAKSAKDLKQAQALLEVLAEDRPDDVPAALAALAGRPGEKAVQAALKKISEG